MKAKIFRVRWVTVELPVAVDLALTLGRVQVLVFPTIWHRGRGDWPSRWREVPTIDRPVYRWWALGPVEVRRFRWATGRRT